MSGQGGLEDRQLPVGFETAEALGRPRPPQGYRGVPSVAASTMLRGGVLTGRPTNGRSVSRCRPAGRYRCPNRRPFAGHEDVGSAAAPSILLGMVSHGYRSPKVPGWAGHLGNVGSYS